MLPEDAERKRILVTGGAGFIGGHLISRLTRSGHYTVYSVDRRNRERTGDEIVVTGDLSAASTYDNVPSVDIVCHLAAQSSARISHESPTDELRDNILATVSLLEFCRRRGVHKIVFASSMGVYGDGTEDTKLREDDILHPTSLYGANKIAAEYYLKVYGQFGIKHTVFRLFNVYGPGQDMENLKQGMVSVYLRFIHDGTEVPVTGSLSRYRDFIYVDDVIDAIMLALADPATDNATFNVGSGRKTTVEELIDLIAAEYGYQHGTYPVREVDGHPGDVKGNMADTGRLQALGWRPQVALENGLRQMVTSLRRGT